MNIDEKNLLRNKLKDNKLWALLIQKLKDENNNYQTENIEKLFEAIYFSAKHIEKIKEYFPKYTIHGIQHSLNVMQIIFNLLLSMEIVQRKQEGFIANITAYEVALLILASFYHDIGMSILDGKPLQEEKWYPEFKNTNKNLNTDELSAKYIRCSHHLRSAIFIEHFDSETGFCWRENSGNILKFLELKRLCVSHNKGKDYIIEVLNNILHHDERLCAILLRLADILDLDNTRAPMDLMEEQNFSTTDSDDNYSYYEWKKHNASEGLLFDSDGILKLTGATSDPIVRKKLSEMVSLIKSELELCQTVLPNSSEPFKNRRLPQNVLDRVESIGFEFGDYSYKIDKTDARIIFMGENLYSSKFVFIRELIQNAIDASICKEKLKKKNSNAVISSSLIKIEIWKDHNSEIHILIEDNGTGMNQSIIDNYFLQIGKSYYNSLDYDKLAIDFKPISRFGIGFLSTFLVASEIDVFTKHYTESNILRQLTLNVDTDTYILRVNDYKRDKRDIVKTISNFNSTDISMSEKFLNKDSGTVIYFKLNTKIAHGDMSVIENEIYKFIFCPPVSIECSIDGNIKIFNQNSNNIMRPLCESLDRDEVLSATRRKKESFKDDDKIYFESIPIRLYSENDKHKVDGHIQATTVYDTSINDYSYIFGYNLNYEKDEVDLNINNIYHKKILEAKLNALHAKAGLDEGVNIYFNGVIHIQHKDDSISTENKKQKIIYNGFILLEGDFRPEVNTSRNGYGTLGFNALFQLNYLFYKSINECKNMNKEMSELLYKNAPRFLNEINDINLTDDLEHLFSDNMEWNDFRFINTNEGFISINDIELLLHQGKTIELRESIKLSNKSFGTLIKTYLILRKFRIQLTLEKRNVKLYIKQSISNDKLLYSKFPPVFFVDYNDVPFLRISDYPLNINHSFSKWLIENSNEHHFENIMDKIIFYMKKSVKQLHKERTELLKNVNLLLKNYEIEELRNQDILLWADQNADMREMLKITF
jgi:hypothetical protein